MNAPSLFFDPALNRPFFVPCAFSLSFPRLARKCSSTSSALAGTHFSAASEMNFKTTSSSAHEWTIGLRLLACFRKRRKMEGWRER